MADSKVTIEIKADEYTITVSIPNEAPQTVRGVRTDTGFHSPEGFHMQNNEDQALLDIVLDLEFGIEDIADELAAGYT